jgi:hypothetical protein
MRRTLTTLALVAAMLLTVALPAAGAPNNKNNADNVISLDCGELGNVMVRPQPGQGNAAWDVDTGENYVAKQFSGIDDVTVAIVDGESVSSTFEFFVSYGAEAPANGRKDLIECTDSVDFVDGPFPIDAEFAAILNADFDTDIFAEGQFVTISVESSLTILVLQPGN